MSNAEVHKQLCAALNAIFDKYGPNLQAFFDDVRRMQEIDKDEVKRLTELHAEQAINNMNVLLDREKVNSLLRQDRDTIAAEAVLLRDALRDSNARLIAHHDSSFIRQQAEEPLGSNCPICSKTPHVFLRNDAVLNTPATDEAVKKIEARGAAEWLEGYLRGLLNMEPNAYTNAAFKPLQDELARLKAEAGE